MPALVFACPVCAAPLDASLACSSCGRVFGLSGGIYRFLLPEREQALAAFLAQYRRVREHDGYHSRPAEYYRALPQVPPGDPQARIWSVRAATFRRLERIMLNSQAASESRQLAVLDLGAGNGWLCNRLVARGHACAAVDWLADDDDGLGAAQHYSTTFTRAQADFDRLPFAPGQFDWVIYNASLHYAQDLDSSLRHGLSMLQPGGRLAIMDSPTFRSRASGERMAAEQARRHNAVDERIEAIRPSQGYLVADEMRAIGRRLGIELRYYATRGDLGWSLRRYWAGLKLQREPASFGLWLGSARSSLIH